LLDEHDELDKSDLLHEHNELDVLDLLHLLHEFNELDELDELDEPHLLHELIEVSLLLHDFDCPQDKLLDGLEDLSLVKQCELDEQSSEV
jgi:hypothetical protein